MGEMNVVEGSRNKSGKNSCFSMYKRSDSQQFYGDENKLSSYFFQQLFFLSCRAALLTIANQTKKLEGTLPT